MRARFNFHPIRTSRIAILLFMIVPLHAAAPAAPQCGQERWDVKDLNDRDAKKINYKPVKKTVAQLRALPVVVPTRHEARRDDEMRTYRVVCEVVKYKLEDDGDIHIVIQDPNNRSEHMIAEIPDPECPDAIDGGHAAKFAAARAAFNELFADHPPGRRMKAVVPAVRVEITGVGFYDFPHKQTGAAPNDLEIHPVLTFKRLP